MASPKHILLILTDQMRYDTISALGNPCMQTPNLDALYRESVVFTHCTTPSPVCVPARLSLMAGQYPARTGCNNNNKEKVWQEEGFYAMLTKGGYPSCCVGKMHHLWDSYGTLGFDERHTQEEIPTSEDEYANTVHAKHPGVFDLFGMRSEMYYVPQISQLPIEDHPTTWIGDKSVAFLKQQEKEKPFFLVSSFIAPHPPFCPPSPWQKLYRTDPPAPILPTEQEQSKYEELFGDRSSCKRLEMSMTDVLRMKNFYYACVSYVDYQIGRIIATLKERDLYDSTLIVFSSDHGDLMGDYRHTGKRVMVESASHVPLLMRIPGKKPQRRADPCSLVDLAPTLLSWADVPYDPEAFDGIDLFGTRQHACVFSQYGCGNNGVYMVTDGKSKLVKSQKSGNYHYFATLPEKEDSYDANDAAQSAMRHMLERYIHRDVSKTRESITYESAPQMPHYPGRMDQPLYHEQERACIPPGYTIDLG
ncbi:MAG: sulfatase-like hydrolase/transferase [Sphaerochaetaceae bacterium]|nr:sulfatase-like hydrolase/transferase [Spirochaetales bacterium]MDY5500053.1 sulfatase-like hydrolase/transferase [Sphaerochaetaceae bacterium]